MLFNFTGSIQLMDIRTQTIEDLIWALSQVRDPAPRQATNGGDDKRPLGYILFLGAGASVEAGIPTAAQLVMRALRKRCEQSTSLAKPSAEMSDAEIEEWAQKEGFYDPAGTDSKYAQVMKNLFKVPALRAEFFRRELHNARVSDGYRLLGELIGRGVFDTILTTNFDHLVRQGADAARPWPIEEVNSVEQYNSLTTFSQEPRILRLHGDFWHSNLRNTQEELSRTPRIIFEAAKKLFKSYGVIVVGYGGEDASLMHGLFPNELWQDETFLGSGLFWCDIREPTELAPRVKSFLSEGGRAERAFYVKIEGFNSLMKRLARPYGISISLEGDMEIDIKESWEWLAFLTDLADAVSIGGETRKPRKGYLERLAQLLGTDRAICASHRNGSAEWEVSVTPAAANEPLLTLEADAVTRSVAELHDPGKDYKQVSADELSAQNAFREFFKGSARVESFPIWQEGKLIGLVSFASSEESLVSSKRTRLIRAAVKLLLAI
ncbi:MAG: SIR2 family protein [Pyrinomonadaceae bacterium]